MLWCRSARQQGNLILRYSLSFPFFFFNITDGELQPAATCIQYDYSGSGWGGGVKLPDYVEKMSLILCTSTLITNLLVPVVLPLVGKSSGL